MKVALVKSFVRVFVNQLDAGAVMINEGNLEKMAVILNQKISAMPFLMKTALSILTHIFDWMGILKAGQCFSCQSFEGQRRMVKSGENSFLPLVRELLRFYQKMTVFIYYSLLQQEA